MHLGIFLMWEEHPRKSGSTKERSFSNKDVKSLLESNSCSLYSTENEEKSSVVERWIRTMKEKCLYIFLQTQRENT